MKDPIITDIFDNFWLKIKLLLINMPGCHDQEIRSDLLRSLPDPVKCLSGRYNKRTCRLDHPHTEFVEYLFNAERHVRKWKAWSTLGIYSRRKVEVQLNPML